MANYSRYPLAPNSFTPEMKETWNALVRTLEDRDAKTTSLNKYHWMLSNVSVNHTYDVSAASANVSVTATALGLLLQELQNKGIIG